MNTKTNCVNVVSENCFFLQNRCHQYQNTISRLSQEVETLRHQLEQIGYDHDPESLLEAHTAALQRHAEESRKQYEKCLDDVANQVVRALLAQKVSCLQTPLKSLLHF